MAAFTTRSASSMRFVYGQCSSRNVSRDLSTSVPGVQQNGGGFAARERQFGHRRTFSSSCGVVATNDQHSGSVGIVGEQFVARAGAGETLFAREPADVQRVSPDEWVERSRAARAE